MNTKPLIKISEKAIETLVSHINTYEQSETKERSLVLVQSKTGLAKWHNRHYGYPLDSELFEYKRLRHFSDMSEIISSSLLEHGLSNLYTLSCNLAGIDETSFGLAFEDAMGGPLMFIARNGDDIYCIFISDYDDYWISKNLWKLLQIKWPSQQA